MARVFPKPQAPDVDFHTNTRTHGHFPSGSYRDIRNYAFVCVYKINSVPRWASDQKVKLNSAKPAIKTINRMFLINFISLNDHTGKKLFKYKPSLI